MSIDLATQSPNGIASAAFINQMALAVEAHDAFIEALNSSWTTFTPTWNGTLGNGTISGRYKALGDNTIACVVGLIWGTTTTGTGSQWTFGLPGAAPAALPGSPFNDHYIGQLRLIDVTGSQYAGSAILASSSTFSSHNNANPIGGVTNTGPFTWANLDRYVATLLYEAA